MKFLYYLLFWKQRLFQKFNFLIEFVYKLDSISIILLALRIYFTFILFQKIKLVDK